jgi:hypothetical protein
MEQGDWAGTEEDAKYRKRLKHSTRSSSRDEASKRRKDPETRVCEVYVNLQQHVTWNMDTYKEGQNQVPNDNYKIFEKYYGANRKEYN